MTRHGDECGEMYYVGVVLLLEGAMDLVGEVFIGENDIVGREREREREGDISFVRAKECRDTCMHERIMLGSGSIECDH